MNADPRELVLGHHEPCPILGLSRRRKADAVSSGVAALSEDARWLAAERQAAKWTVAELARATGIRRGQIEAMEAGEQGLPRDLRFRVRAVCLARGEELAKTEDVRARLHLSPHPHLVATLALVDPGTLAAAMAEAERRRQAGEDIGYEGVLGEWAARPR